MNEACKQIGFKITWIGNGLNEKAILINKNKKSTLIRIDKKYFRPLEVDYLKGNSKKAFKQLKFKPKYNFKTLIGDMLKHDLDLAKKELLLSNND